MKYKLEPRMNDGKAEASPLTIETDTFDEALEALAIQLPVELANDYGEPFDPGFTLTITRLD